MPAGRPTDCTPEVIEKARYYLENYKEFEDVVPQIASLALHLGVRRDTLYEWAKSSEKKEFTDIFEAVKTKQEKTLINGSLLGNMNPAISKMMLTKHGYSDKLEQAIDHTSGGDKLTATIHFVRSDKPT